MAFCLYAVCLINSIFVVIIASDLSITVISYF